MEYGSFFTFFFSFNFLRYSQLALQSDFTNLHSHQQGIHVLVTPLPPKPLVLSEFLGFFPRLIVVNGVSLQIPHNGGSLGIIILFSSLLFP